MELLEKFKRRPPYIFNISSDILDTLSLKEDVNDNSRNEIPDTATSKADEPLTADSAEETKICSLCKVSYFASIDQKSHIKSDLHGYNLKQKIRGLPPVTEKEFEELLRDLHDSISGSDSSATEGEENEERKEKSISALLKKQALISLDYSEKSCPDSNEISYIPKKSPLIWFSTTLFPNICLGIYRSALNNPEQLNDLHILDLLKQKQLVPKPQAPIPKNSSSKSVLVGACQEPHYFLCMIGGGHFAAMVVSLIPKESRTVPTGPLINDISILAHKTFHRYTTRRKQGGAQSANDSAKGAAHSAGASLRRYNEQALTEEVRILLQEWKDMIDSSELLFIRATGSTNRRTLFGPYSNQVLRSDDPRIRGFPFSTRRATQSELMRSFIELTRVKVLELNDKANATTKDTFKSATAESSAANATKNISKQVPRLTEEEETALLHTSKLQALIRRNRLPALLTYLRENSLSPDFRFHPLDSPQNHHAPTPLLLAASLNLVPLITGLLLKAGSNPNIRNNDGKTAFELSAERASRQAFCVARFELGEDKWNWDGSGIPKGISRIEAEERNKKEKEEEQRKEFKRRKAEIDKIKNQEEKEEPQLSRRKASVLARLPKTAEEKRVEEAKGLTPEMQMRLERERRARAAEERMKKMAQKPC